MSPFVVALAYRRLGGHEELARDAAQDVFIRLLRTCPFARLEDADALRAYVWRTADNVSRDYRRRLDDNAKRTSPLEISEIASAVQSQPSDSIAFQQWFSSMSRHLLPIDREILLMTAQGYDLNEIAEATGLTYSNTAVRLHRLRRRLSKPFK